MDLYTQHPDLAASTPASPDNEEVKLVRQFSFREFTPLRRKVFDAYVKALQTVLGLLLAAAVFNLWAFGKLSMEPTAFLAGKYLLLYAFYLAVGWFAITRKITFKMTVHTFSVSRPYGWQVYDRAVSHQFVVLAHRHAPEEKFEHDHRRLEAQQQGKVLKLKPYYAQSAHVAMIYANEMKDLATVYGLANAEKIARKLGHFDVTLDASIGKKKPWRDEPEGPQDPGGLS